MRAVPLLSWGAQVAAHAAYVEAHRVEVTPPHDRRAEAGHGVRTTGQSQANRAALLHALRDGQSHRFVDIVAALPGLSRNGIYYLIAALRDEGRITQTCLDRGNRRYRLT